MSEISKSLKEGLCLLRLSLDYNARQELYESENLFADLMMNEEEDFPIKYERDDEGNIIAYRDYYNAPGVRG